MNDGVCDPHGRFWAGSMALDLTPGGGSLYRTDHDGTVHRVLDGLTIVNGPTFNADGDLLYLADTAAAVVYRYGVAADGTLHDRREFARLTHGLPDGMTVDTEGCLWLAVWDGHAVHRYHPDGTLLTTIQVPATRPTSVCLPPGSGQLFITTARRGLTDPAPADGAVLTVPVPATGLPTRGYRPALSR
jgi:sugar lactone lactonase YvrE